MRRITLPFLLSLILSGCAASNTITATEKEWTQISADAATTADQEMLLVLESRSSSGRPRRGDFDQRR
jgi:uncharacterized protein YceK